MDRQIPQKKQMKKQLMRFGKTVTALARLVTVAVAAINDSCSSINAKSLIGSNGKISITTSSTPASYRQWRCNKQGGRETSFQSLLHNKVKRSRNRTYFYSRSAGQSWLSFLSPHR